MTHGFAESPRSTAFFARRPAPSMTDGFDVFVHDVIAAMTHAQQYGAFEYHAIERILAMVPKERQTMLSKDALPRERILDLFIKK